MKRLNSEQREALKEFIAGFIGFAMMFAIIAAMTIIGG